jgi:GNAT superfamily N-acetyltransferase
MSNTSNYEVRPATMRDAKVISEIHGKASQSYWREAIEFSEPQVYVAIDGGQVVGFVGFDRSRDKGTPPTMGEIWAIHVLPTHWGKGIGLALWDAAREGLLEEGCTQVSLWLPLAGERALRFHELAGFKREMNSIKTVPAGSAKIEQIRLKRELG